MKKTQMIFTIALLFLAACAHHRDVRPGVDGVNFVRVSTDNVDQGTRAAISQANHYCEEQKKRPAFVEEKSQYKGDMDEQTYKNAKRATTVAKTVGGAVWVFGGERERPLGGLAGLGGTVGDQVLGEGYAVEMRFRCQ